MTPRIVGLVAALALANWLLPVRAEPPKEVPPATPKDAQADGDKRPSAIKESREQVKQLQARIKDLETLIEKESRDLRELGLKLTQAQRRLAEHRAPALPEGKVAMAVRMKPEVAASGFIVPGTHVDVIHVQGKEAKVILEDILVFAVEVGDKPVRNDTVTLALSADEAKMLLKHMDKGSIELVLRASGGGNPRPQSPEGARTVEKRLDDIERRLDAVMKLLEQIRRERVAPPPPPPPDEKKNR